MSIFPTRILLATDNSEEAQSAATTAADLAKSTGSELHVLRVDEHEEEAQQLLEAQVKRITEAGDSVAQVHIRKGRADQEIVTLAEEIDAGLIVMGRRGLGRAQRALVGSVSDSVIRHAHCPVLVVSADPLDFPVRILVGTDGSREAEQATLTAADLAKGTNSELHLAYVFPTVRQWPFPNPMTGRPSEVLENELEEAMGQAQSFLDQQVEQLKGEGVEVAYAHLLKGQPDRELVHFGEEIDAGLIVTGRRGLGGIRRRLMGSVADSVVRHAHIPVLATAPGEPGAHIRPTSSELLPPWPTHPQHVVSTGFSKPDQPGEPRPADRALRPDQPYLFWIEVGLPVEGAIDETLTELPIELLPKDAELDVVLLTNDPAVAVKGSARGVLFFDSEGAVSVRTPAHRPDAMPADDSLLRQRLFFQVHTPSEEGEYRLRCSIFYRQVLVQSREVTLRVSTSEAPRARSLVTRLDYSISRSLSPAHLRDYQPHKLSIMVNRGDDGSHNFHFVGEDDYKATADFDGHEVQDMIRRLRRGLHRVSWDSEEPWDPGRFRYRYTTSASFDHLCHDLHAMARTGIRVYDTIADRLGGGPQGAQELRKRMRTPGMVQFALRESVRLVVPFALLYDYPLDTMIRLEHCRLCEHFQRSVGDDKPLHEHACFTGACPSYDDKEVVCPGGFWGFRHDLGMPPTLPPEGDSPPNVPGTLEPADDVDLAVAVCTDDQLQKRVSHINVLRHLLPPQQFRYADTRANTLNMMRSAKAQVFYFYCHGGVDAQTPYIQVGPLSDPGIDRSNLREYGIRWVAPRPLVFVNGCHTVNVEPEVAIEMVSGFVQTAGASAVIGTEITVFEPLAVSFGQRFLSAFLAGDKLGSAVRTSRLAILKEQLNPLGLVYIPFGLASLHLAE